MSIGAIFSRRINSIKGSRVMRQASKMFETFALMMVTLSLVSSVSVAAAATATIGFSEQPQIQPHAAALISSSSVSASASASSITKPDYGITNVTAQIGTNAYLPCKVSGQHDFFFLYLSSSVLFFVFFSIFVIRLNTVRAFELRAFVAETLLKQRTAIVVQKGDDNGHSIERK